MFLDVCYLVQHVLVQMGIVNKQICGFAFLPDVNLSAVTDPGTRTYIQANFREKISIDALSKRIGLSVSYFRKSNSFGIEMNVLIFVFSHH